MATTTPPAASLYWTDVDLGEIVVSVSFLLVLGAWLAYYLWAVRP